ncbi:MAG TPA: PA2779 family protein [Candidatus Limnocylindria bacterium]|nr:PA2779 family protein [Candidatus Limnocylindria bacterium]
MHCFSRRIRFWTALFLVLYWCGLNAAPAAAGLVPSRVSGATEVTSARDADLLVVQRTLEHKLVAQKLHDYGVTPDDVRVKLAGMSDAELHQLASASKGLPSGSDGLGTLIAVLVIVILIIVVVKLMNKEIVIK